MIAVYTIEECPFLVRNNRIDEWEVSMFKTR